MRLFQTLILAGGLGTRMRHRTGSSPKALLQVGGRPFLAWQLDLLEAQGIERVLISAGFGGREIEKFLQQSPERRLQIDVIQEPESLLGTAGAIRFCIESGKVDPAFFVTYGDSYLTFPFVKAQEAFEKARQPVLMTVFNNHGNFDRSNVWIDGDQIRLYSKAPTAQESARLTAIDYGLLVVSREWISAEVPLGLSRGLSEVLEPLSRSGRLAGLVVPDRFFEVGSERGLKDFENYVRDAVP